MTRRSIVLALCSLVGAACLPPTRGSAAHAQAAGTRVLFIGNSLTYRHDLPRTVEQLAALSGDVIRTEMIARPDFALLDHVDAGDVQKVLLREHWDIVVMQQGSSALEEGRSWLYRGVDQLAPLIRAAGGRPALYEVWPTRDRGFDVAKVHESYLTAARHVNGLFLPAGTAWLEAWKRDPSLALYDDDGLHPTNIGTFLVALVMVERLTAKDVRTLPAVAFADGRSLALAEPTVRLLQAAAHAANQHIDAQPPPTRQ